MDLKAEHARLLAAKEELVQKFLFTHGQLVGQIDLLAKLIEDQEPAPPPPDGSPPTA